MSHPLDGARARIERANKHLRELDSLVETYWNAYANGVTVNEHPEVRRLAVITGRLMPPLPIEMALLVSDAIHNCRCALDYVIYELAIHDSGTIQQGTQFKLAEVVCQTKPALFEGLDQSTHHSSRAAAAV